MEVLQKVKMLSILIGDRFRITEHLFDPDCFENFDGIVSGLHYFQPFGAVCVLSEALQMR